MVRPAISFGAKSPNTSIIGSDTWLLAVRISAARMRASSHAATLIQLSGGRAYEPCSRPLARPHKHGIRIGVFLSQLFGAYYPRIDMVAEIRLKDLAQPRSIGLGEVIQLRIRRRRIRHRRADDQDRSDFRMLG